MIFSAIAMMVFAGSAFASNEIVNESLDVVNESVIVTNDGLEDNTGIIYKFTCNVSIHYIDFWGNEQVHKETKYFYFVPPLEGAAKCHQHADTVEQNVIALNPSLKIS